MNNDNLEQQTKVKEKKVYLSSNINDDNQKKSVDYIKKMIVKEVIYKYTGKKPTGIEYDLFYKYLESKTKPNNSPNSFNLRIERIYNSIVNMYSDFIQDYGDILTTAELKSNDNTTSEDIMINTYETII